jgi:hypothetical protein
VANFGGVITLNGAITINLITIVISSEGFELFTYADIAGQASDDSLEGSVNVDANATVPSVRAVTPGYQVVCGAKGTGVRSCRLVPAVASGGNVIVKVPDQETEAKRLGVGLGVGLGVPFLILIAIIAGLLFSRSRGPVAAAPGGFATAAAAAPGSSTSFTDSAYYGSSAYSGYSDLEGGSSYGTDSYGSGGSYGGSGYSGTEASGTSSYGGSSYGGGDGDYSGY